MWPYWLLFIVPAYWAISRLNPRPQAALLARVDRWPFAWKSIFVFLVLIIGWRHEVGGDWFNYMANMDNFVSVTGFNDLSNECVD